MSIGFRTVLPAIMMGLVLFGEGRVVVNETTKKTDLLPDKGNFQVGFSNVSKNLSTGTGIRTNQREGKNISSPYNKVQDLISIDKSVKKSHASEKDQRHLISALSKIARVRLANQDQDLVDFTQSSLSRTILKKPEDIGSVPETQNEFDSSKKWEKSRKYHCRAIRDVYIPEIKGTMPAYHCKFGNKTFVLSSVRFLQDRRSFLDIEIDDDAVQELRVGPKVPRNNSFEILPAILVLKLGDDNYKIRSRSRNSGELMDKAN